MVPTPPAEPLEINTFKEIARITFLQTHNEQINSIHTQPMYSNSTSANHNTNSSPQNNNIHPHNQPTVILQQFSMMTRELRNFMEKVCGDIIEIMQACIVAQENAGKLIENAISHALTKPQDVMPLNLTINPRTFRTNCASNSSYKTNWTSPWQTNNFGIPQQSNMTCIIHRDLMKHLYLPMLMESSIPTAQPHLASSHFHPP